MLAGVGESLNSFAPIPGLDAKPQGVGCLWFFRRP